MTIQKNEIRNSLVDGKSRRSSKSPLLEQLIWMGWASFLLLHRSKKSIKTIDLHFLHKTEQGGTYVKDLRLMAINSNTPESTCCHDRLSALSLHQQGSFSQQAIQRHEEYRDVLIQHDWQVRLCHQDYWSKYIRCTSHDICSCWAASRRSKETNPASRLHNQIYLDNRHD